MTKRSNIIITVVGVLVLIQQLFLRPTSVEISEDDPQGMFSSIEAQLEAAKIKDEVKYTLEGIHYTSIEGGKKQSEMTATEAVVYDKTNLFVAENVKMKMFDPTEKSTDIDGKRAYFKMGTKEMDIENDVKVTFPDGFWIKTEKVHYSAADQRVTSQEPFYGESIPQKGITDHMKVWGTGFLGSKLSSDVYILKNSHAVIRHDGNAEITDVRSDQAKINRFTRQTEFTMNQPTSFVETLQGTLNIKSRRQDATYDTKESQLKYMTAWDDVTINETDAKKLSEGMKYATCQKAEFHTKQNKILLSGFPSVYQDNDTVTGEVITIYRDTNIVEVTEANAYHDGAR